MAECVHVAQLNNLAPLTIHGSFWQGRGNSNRGAPRGGSNRPGQPVREAKAPILDLAKYVDTQGSHKTALIMTSGLRTILKMQSGSSSLEVEKVGRAAASALSALDHGSHSLIPVPVLTVTGTLKGYDALLNLVLDEVEEDIRGEQLSAHIVYHKKF